jgi:hypothetical protein
VRDQNPHPYETTGKITFLYMSIFTFLDKHFILCLHT